MGEVERKGRGGQGDGAEPAYAEARHPITPARAARQSANAPSGVALHTSTASASEWSLRRAKGAGVQWKEALKRKLDGVTTTVMQAVVLFQGAIINEKLAEKVPDAVPGALLEYVLNKPFSELTNYLAKTIAFEAEGGQNDHQRGCCAQQEQFQGVAQARRRW